MKEKMKYVMVVLIAVVLIGVGISFSYFSLDSSVTGEESEIIVDTAEIMRTKLTVSGEIEFDDQDILPGHQNVSSIKVVATGEDEVVYNLIWTGENTLNTPLKYYVYKTSEKQEVKITCNKEIEGNVVKKYYEECEKEGFEELGEVIAEGTIPNTEEMKFIIKDQEVVEANPKGKEVYYYVVIEYPNLDEDQYPLDKGGRFSGEVGIEAISGTAIKPEIKNITTSATSNSITIGVEATDNSGIGGYYYKIGDKGYERSNDATYTFEGLEEYKEYEIRVYVEDIYGNRSEEETRKVRTEDATSPQIIITSEVEEGENGWYKRVEIIGEARDEGAGVATVRYCTTTGSTCSPNIEISNQGKVSLSSNTSSQKVCYEAEDGSGNRSDIVCSGGYKVDQEKPNVTISSTTETEDSITINVSGRDSHSGIQSYKYSINNGTYIQTTSNSHTFTGLEAGTSYHIKVQSVDKAGNISDEVTKDVTTDRRNAKDTILANSKVNEGEPIFGQLATTDEGIYKAEDDWGESYYFRGAVTNNWVKFAGYYWRIIRINGDGSIRVIYSGDTESGPVITGNSTMINNGVSKVFNSNSDRSEYVGYMYNINQQHGNAFDSSIKTEMDNWYDNNLASHADKISKEVGFCVDREMITGSSWSSQPDYLYYAIYERVQMKNTPNLKCSNSVDLYTVSGSDKGNHALTNPIGLITADEILMAGAKSGSTNYKYYLYNNEYYWTMSPYAFGDDNANVFAIFDSGYFGALRVNHREPGIRPVINIASDVEITGSGTSTDPYVVA